MTTVDAVVIGSGPNGLVSANLLADAGWSVLLLEAQSTIGGAVASDSSVAQGYVHDTFSSFYPLAAASPTIQGLGLDRFGLEWVHAPAVCGHPLRTGGWAVLERDRHTTAAGLDALHAGDGDAWLDLCTTWDRVGDHVIDALLTPFPPVRSGLGLARRVPGAGGLALAQALLRPVRSLAARSFRGEGPRLLLAGNAAHSDIPLDAPGSGFMALLLVMLGQAHGFPVPRGGAGRLSAAIADRFTALGGEIRVGTPATGIVVRNGRAVAVRTPDDEVAVRRAVVADVSAPALYGGLVPWEELPHHLRARMRRFEWDPGTVKVDWALDGPIPWRDAPDRPPGTVHLADSVDEITRTMDEIRSGLVPSAPFILLGQMAAADPGRAPVGHEAVWAYTHVPQRIRGDLGSVTGAGFGGGSGSGAQGSRTITGRWDRDEAERFADRMEARVERFAPGFRDLVVARRVLGPRELEARDANLVGGALNGGTATLRQQLVLRPVPGLGRPETPVEGLYLGSASAHPGGGVHGACGANAARAALWHNRVRRRFPGPGNRKLKGRMQGSQVQDSHVPESRMQESRIPESHGPGPTT
ncbi:FAD-dependent oxidoreductase [Intrasporangium oryzae NRRL B-24470]|uniref:Pyridine nucleotide-disulfide oxidoreductase domain-containing protein 2 n=1 Tax=Intrasporangium oryzae NRRL B-24470 TaxID=1386089 RepID=W9G7F4_9MICO|nr:NAD(P)/FAD-dependent oxidoreductase [Intrasporangium oryzae]EWT02096.1 FAD-dependent oxidoreductase [Intrasporangium oryzae NRRL B-24470]